MGLRALVFSQGPPTGMIWILSCYVLKMNPLKDLSFRLYPFQELSLQTSPAKFFSEFYTVSFAGTIIFDSFLSRKLAQERFLFFKSFSVSFCHRKRHHQEPCQIVSNVESCDSQRVGLKTSDWTIAYDANSSLIFSFITGDLFGPLSLTGRSVWFAIANEGTVWLAITSVSGFLVLFCWTPTTTLMKLVLYGVANFAFSYTRR